MRAWIGIVLLGLALAACQSRVEAAKAKLAMAEKSGNRDEMCRQSRELKDAYLQARDQGRYELAAITERAYC